MENKTKVKVILNESHFLMEDQERVLNETFEDNWEILPVPAEGWSLAEMREIAKSFSGNTVVFASPVPALLSILSRESGAYYERMVEGLDHPESSILVKRVFVLHNDNRCAKEISLPNGKTKVIHTVAKTGWELV